MRLTARESLAALTVGIVVNLLLAALAFVTPLGSPTRNQVDNALLILGGVGLLNAWLVGRAGMLSARRSVRVAAGVYAVLSTACVGLADFGALRRAGWVIKATAVGVLFLALRDLRRR